jgi:hypothetical protein
LHTFTTTDWFSLSLPSAAAATAAACCLSQGETRVKVAGTFQGENGNPIKTCQTRRGLILAGSAIPIDIIAAGAAATIMSDSDKPYNGDSDKPYKRSYEYEPRPKLVVPEFKGEAVIFNPVMVSCLRWVYSQTLQTRGSHVLYSMGGTTR